jgi:hypothetical protein
VRARVARVELSVAAFSFACVAGGTDRRRTARPVRRPPHRSTTCSPRSRLRRQRRSRRGCACQLVLGGVAQHARGAEERDRLVHLRERLSRGSTRRPRLLRNAAFPGISLPLCPPTPPFIRRSTTHDREVGVGTRLPQLRSPVLPADAAAASAPSVGEQNPRQRCCCSSAAGAVERPVRTGAPATKREPEMSRLTSLDRHIHRTTPYGTPGRSSAAKPMLRSTNVPLEVPLAARPPVDVQGAGPEPILPNATRMQSADSEHGGAMHARPLPPANQGQWACAWPRRVGSSA